MAELDPALQPVVAVVEYFQSEPNGVPCAGGDEHASPSGATREAVRAVGVGREDADRVGALDRERRPARTGRAAMLVHRLGGDQAR